MALPLIIQCIFVLIVCDFTIASDTKKDDIAILARRMIELQEKYDLKLNGMEQSLFLANTRIQESEERILWLEKQLESREENGDQNGSRLHATHSLSSRSKSDNQDLTSRLEGNSSLNGYVNEGKRERLFSSDFRERKSSNGQDVAFSAYSECGTLGLSYHETFPFDKVLVNVGGGFDVNIHTFVCPISGVYFFTNTMTGLQHKVETEIVLEGATQAVITTGEGEFNQGVNSAVIHCLHGQRVWVRAWQAVTGGIYCQHWSTFSGFLLSLDDVSSS